MLRFFSISNKKSEPNQRSSILIPQKAKMLAIVALASFALNNCKEKNDPNKVLIIGTDKNGNEKVFRAPEALFHGIFQNVAERTERSTLKALNKNPDDPKFNLSRVSVGLKIEAEGGISNVMSLGGEAAFELRFEPLPKPTNTQSIL
jgi:hypothetical protein